MVKDLPILPELSSNLEQELIRRSIFGTAAIEGNPLTEDKVDEIISKPDNFKSKKNAEIEIRNLKNAYEFIKNINQIESQFKLEEGLIKEAHALITENVMDEQNNPGHYRNHKVQVGDRNHGGVFTPPKCLEDISKLMGEYIEWINRDEMMGLDAWIRASLAHYYLGLIHPFGNGNGRTARLIEALLLQVSGIKYIPAMLSNYYYQNIDDYFWAFSNTIRNKESSVTPFLKFTLQGSMLSLRAIKERITFYIRKFSLRDYYSFLREKRKVTQRQFDLLIGLLDYDKTFSLPDLFNRPQFKILYRNVSERTARRDISKLTKERFLYIAEDGHLALNWRVIG
jgi:Fic family protein